MISNILLGIIIVALVVLSLVALTLGAEVVRLRRRVYKLELRSHGHLTGQEPEMSATSPHGEPPPASQPVSQPASHAMPMQLVIQRTDTVGQRKITPSDLDVVAPWLDQSVHPKPIPASRLVARHAAKEK